MKCALDVVALIALFVLSWLFVVLVFFRREIRAAFDRDPAANNLIEVALLYSGVQALVLYRIAHFVLKIKIPIVPRFISQCAKFITGIEIHPGARIGQGVFIDHGMGVIIGETSIVGDNVTFFQGVTLGGTGKKQGKRHPTIGNNVVIGAGAKVLGDISIGDNSYVGANAVVIKNIPPNSTVVGVPGRLAKQDGKKIEEQLDHNHIIDPVLVRLQDLQSRIDKLEQK